MEFELKFLVFCVCSFSGDSASSQYIFKFSCDLAIKDSSSFVTFLGPQTRCSCRVQFSLRAGPCTARLAVASAMKKPKSTSSEPLLQLTFETRIVTIWSFATLASGKRISLPLKVGAPAVAVPTTTWAVRGNWCVKGKDSPGSRRMHLRASVVYTLPSLARGPKNPAWVAHS